MLTTIDIMWPEGEAATMEPSLRILCTLSELYDRELVAAIGWAKQIPGELFYSWMCLGNDVSRIQFYFVTFVMGNCVLDRVPGNAAQRSDETTADKLARGTHIVAGLPLHPVEQYPSQVAMVG